MRFPACRRGLLAAIGVLAWGTAAAAQPISLGQKAKLDGIISGRAGASMTLRMEGAASAVILLTENTDVAATKGRLGLIKQEAAATALIPGLKVKVEGVGDDKGQLIATKVRFTGGDLKTARAIAAGLAETEERLDATQAQVAVNKDEIAENRKEIARVKGDQADLARRFGQLGEYDVKDEAIVYFEVGSAVLSEEAARDLGRVAETAKGLKGYLIGVEGYADSSGSVARNQKLSLERSQAVVNWLAQEGGIPFVHMLAPGAMSTAKPAASNETTAGRSQNRRVVVKVLVNRGLAEAS
jgi:OmpA-OmpF porin, OOP family